MLGRKIVAALGAASLMATPVLAASQTASAPLPRSETVSGDSRIFDRPGAPFAPIMFAIIIALGAWMAIDGWEDDDRPVSP